MNSNQKLTNWWKKAAKDYLSFTRKDRLGALVILTVCLGCYLFPKLSETSSKKVAIEQTPALLAAIDTLDKRNNDRPRFQEEPENAVAYQFEPSRGAAFIKAELFSFDPNTLTPEGWQRLGLSEKTSLTIEKYRNKGGKFRKPEDVQKIWGLPKGFYERVKDYISIAEAPKPEYSTGSYTPYPKYEKPEHSIKTVNINADDTAAFIALPGIGSKLAARITAFRDKLGGFYSVEQIGETYGLPDSTFQKIKPYLSANVSGVRKININSATKDELKAHPYIRWNLANAIVEYRNQHGAFRSLEALKDIALLNESTFSKILPYLSL